MDIVKQLIGYLTRVTSDVRLGSTHISLYTVLCLAWLVNGSKKTFTISRRQVMRASRIKSKTTYHKVINELKLLGYVDYQPSFDPNGSKVSLLS